MRFLVTGGAGAVGKDLTPALLDAGHTVRILDANADASATRHKNVEVIRGRVEDRSLVAGAVEGVDVVLHLAWSFSQDPRELVESDLAGLIALLDASVAAKVSHFFFISSAIVYGSVTSFCVPEDAPCPAEKARKPFYGAAKLAAEKFALAYHSAKGLPVTVFRFWWSYGEEIGGRHLRDMLNRAVTGEALAVPQSSGGSFLHHADLTNAVLLALRDPKTHGEVFNLSTIYLSWEDIARMIIQVTGSSSRLDVISPREWKGAQFLADSWRLCTSKAEQLFGWQTLFTRETARERLKNAIAKGFRK